MNARSFEYRVVVGLEFFSHRNIPFFSQTDWRNMSVPEVFHFGAAMSAMSTWQQALALLDRAKECDAANIVPEHQQTRMKMRKSSMDIDMFIQVSTDSHEISRATFALMHAVHVTVFKLSMSDCLRWWSTLPSIAAPRAERGQWQ